MTAFLYTTILQWKLDIRGKSILVPYYLVPILFFLFIGGVFTSIMPDAYKTLIQSMTVFGATMGGIIGTPTPLVELYSSDVKKAYCIGKIPLWTIALSNSISAFLHLSVMSIIIFLLAPIVFDASIPADLLVYVVSFVLMLIANISIGTLLGLFVKTFSKLTMISQFIFLPSIMLSGIMFPVEMLPEYLIFVGKLFPATWGYEMMCNNTLTFDGILPLLIIIVTMFIIATIKLCKMQKE